MDCKTGLDKLSKSDIPGSNIGLLTHYAAVTSNLSNSVKCILDIQNIRLRAVFGPQHGFFGETQDNMIEWNTYDHPLLNIPVYSLYGETRKPNAEMLCGLDCMIIDLQDVGARYYTYIYTMALVLRACAEADIPVVILDRPNPLGGRIIEGANLDTDYSSFVGMYPIPVRHALTIGELARYFALLDGLPEPSVVLMESWDTLGFPEELPWVMPSPNMPTTDTAAVYPGMCLLEATNLSEGRGTTRPFEIFGAPWLKADLLVDELNGSEFARGAVLRQHSFIPTFNKHSGVQCNGAQIHITNHSIFRPLKMVLGILIHCFGYSETVWNPPPYEYEYTEMPIDILAGTDLVRKAVDFGDTETLLKFAEGNPEEYLELIGKITLYKREFIS